MGRAKAHGPTPDQRQRGDFAWIPPLITRSLLGGGGQSDCYGKQRPHRTGGRQSPHRHSPPMPARRSAGGGAQHVNALSGRIPPQKALQLISVPNQIARGGCNAMVTPGPSRSRLRAVLCSSFTSGIEPSGKAPNRLPESPAVFQPPIWTTASVDFGGVISMGCSHQRQEESEVVPSRHRVGRRAANLVTVEPIPEAV